MTGYRTVRIAALGVFLMGCAGAQNAPNVSQVLMWSTVNNTGVGAQNSQDVSGLFTPRTSGVLPQALLNIYTVRDIGGLANGDVTALNTPANYGVGNVSALNSAISSNIGLALALIPVASPASAVIQKVDPVTGAPTAASNTLGPVFTERAETIGKGKFFIGFSHQAYHFTEINGKKLNGLSVLYPGGDPSAAGPSAPMTFNLGLDVRLSQTLAFLTYGVSDRFDISVGLPMVHAAVAATSYNAQVFSGAGLGTNGNNCWCQNTLSPGTFVLTEPLIGRSSMSKTGFGDVLVRAKAAVLSRSSAVVSVGTDLRFATGDADNYLGTGTTTVKPFAAISLYTQPTASGFVFSPHLNIGWQFSGKSALGGTFQGSNLSATLANGDRINYVGAPLTVVKDNLPDVIAWAAGTEVAMGKRNTLVVDFLGNQIGLINGAQVVQETSASGFSPVGPAFAATTVQGFVGAGKSSFGQYSGSFGYKARVTGKLVATFNLLVRLNDTGLTAKYVPLYGLSYSF